MESNLINTYGRLPVTLSRADGNYLYDTEGKKYLDLISGISVTNLGHRNPKMLGAFSNAAEDLLFYPNFFNFESQEKLAGLLIANSIAGKVFFSNSGTEANEAAIKFARLYGSGNRYEIITINNGFHGRSMGSLSATAQNKVQDGFAPLLPGFVHVDQNDIPALQAAITESTVAIMLEVVQGEGGIRAINPDFAQAVNRLQKDKDLLVIVDEVQTGMGRTGSFLAYQQFDLQPDIITMAKALGGGLPIGATIASDRVAAGVTPGKHGSTFGGGNAIVAAAASLVSQTISPDITQKIKYLTELFASQCTTLQNENPHISIRQHGLMIGIEVPNLDESFVSDCLEDGVFINVTSGNVIRLLPPFTLEESEIKFAFEVIKKHL